MSYPWSEEQAEQLKVLWAKGLSCSDIGERLSVTRNAVIGKVRRLGLPMRRPSKHSKGSEAIPRRYNIVGDAVDGFDPKRADKLLRRFSWEAQQ